MVPVVIFSLAIASLFNKMKAKASILPCDKNVNTLNVS